MAPGTSPGPFMSAGCGRYASFSWAVSLEAHTLTCGSLGSEASTISRLLLATTPVRPEFLAVSSPCILDSLSWATVH
jgi:hypothetical protein